MLAEEMRAAFGWDGRREEEKPAASGSDGQHTWKVPSAAANHGRFFGPLVEASNQVIDSPEAKMSHYDIKSKSSSPTTLSSPRRTFIFEARPEHGTQSGDVHCPFPKPGCPNFLCPKVSCHGLAKPFASEIEIEIVFKLNLPAKAQYIYT